MGISTVVIGLLPTYDSIGIWATILLCLCRIGQGIGLGGEWGGAALVAVENAPEGKRGWYGTFPQLGAPLGLLLANGVFLGITAIFGQEAMTEWAWRIPFLSSVILVAIGLYVRLKLTEAPIFLAALNKPQPKRLPMLEVVTTHFKPFFLGMLVCIAGYVLFYIMIAFSQIYAKSAPTVSEAGYAMGLGLSPQIFYRFIDGKCGFFGYYHRRFGQIYRQSWSPYLAHLDNRWRCDFWFILAVISRKRYNYQFVFVLFIGMG
ncbi:metabolite transport protein [Haemophilus influenzae]|uniref:Metabolite transport protein n=1 Tax=Haemophilus influenzae TaxID=727 RepID=A0A2X1PKW1_HAEIF|nr:metabolite transport protein [Haemophilus influenzae]